MIGRFLARAFWATVVLGGLALAIYGMVRVLWLIFTGKLDIG